MIVAQISYNSAYGRNGSVILDTTVWLVNTTNGMTYRDDGRPVTLPEPFTDPAYLTAIRGVSSAAAAAAGWGVPDRIVAPALVLTTGV
jgi:hypothetical protein